HGLREAVEIVDEIVAKEVGEVTLQSDQAQVFGELQIRSSLAQLLEKQRSVAAETAVREQFEADLRGLTDAEQDSKQLKSAKRKRVYEGIVETVKVPLPGGGEDGDKDSLTKSYVKKACDAIYKQLVRTKIAVDKRRPDGRSETEIRPIEVEVSVMPRTHG